MLAWRPTTDEQIKKKKLDMPDERRNVQKTFQGNNYFQGLYMYKGLNMYN